MIDGHNTFGSGAQVLLGAVFDVEQPLGEAVMEQHESAGPRDRDDPAQQVELAIELLVGERAVRRRLDAVEEDRLADRQLGRQYDVQQGLDPGELLAAEEALAQPQVQAVQRTCGQDNIESLLVGFFGGRGGGGGVKVRVVVAFALLFSQI